MELKGKIIQTLDLQTGEGKNGTWRKQEYVLETVETKYPKKVCFQVWNDKIDQFALQSGDDIVADVDIESREFNGRWYTNVQAWKVQKSSTEEPGINQEAPNQDQVPDFIANSDETDELPF